MHMSTDDHRPMIWPYSVFEESSFTNKFSPRKMRCAAALAHFLPSRSFFGRIGRIPRTKEKRLLPLLFAISVMVYIELFRGPKTRTINIVWTGRFLQMLLENRRLMR